MPRARADHARRSNPCLSGPATWVAAAAITSSSPRDRFQSSGQATKAPILLLATRAFRQHACGPAALVTWLHLVAEHQRRAAGVDKADGAVSGCPVPPREPTIASAHLEEHSATASPRTMPGRGCRRRCGAREHNGKGAQECEAREGLHDRGGHDRRDVVSRCDRSRDSCGQASGAAGQATARGVAPVAHTGASTKGPVPADAAAAD